MFFHEFYHIFDVFLYNNYPTKSTIFQKCLFCWKSYLCIKTFNLIQNFIIEQLKKEFEKRESFSKQELFDFYLRYEPKLKETTFRWRIFDLKEKGIIGPLSRDLLTLTNKPVFKPQINDAERRLANRIMKQFYPLGLCIWSTKILSEFMLHQPGKFITILEVEKAAVEPVFHFLKDIHTKDVYLLPQEKRAGMVCL